MRGAFGSSVGRLKALAVGEKPSAVRFWPCGDDIVESGTLSSIVEY